MAVRVAGAGLLAVVMMAWLALATPTRADSAFTEEMLRVPFPAPSAAKLTLVARLYRPAGAGPFPLAVVNHGASRTDAASPAWFDWSAEPSRWFAARGYATLLLMRRGYAGSGGTWADGYGSCANPVYHEVGLETAQDIRAGVEFVRDRSDVDGRRTVLIGHSAGAHGALALASTNVPGLAGVVFAPPLVRRMHVAYVQAGGRAELHVLPPFGPNGHSFFNRAGATSQWGPPVRAFLARIGLPS
jgi:dienelactone hydrolase